MYKTPMFKVYQQTISNPVSIEGIGLHTGKKSKITLLPAKENQGIIFKRVDLKKNNLIFADYKNVSDTQLCTSIKNNHDIKVTTIEHLLAALYISEIDNVLIEINDSEVPIMDGSAKPFINILNKTKKVQLSKKRKYMKINEKVLLEKNGRKISIKPSDYFEVDYKLNFENKIIGKQKNLVNFQTDNLKNIYTSRTFCLYEDIERIKKIGLAKGGSLNNAVVVDEKSVLNKEGLRNNQEFVNHKILDLAGDFLLSGHRVIGKVLCNQGGHELTNLFLKKLISQKSAFSIIELQDDLVSEEISSNNSIKIAVNA